jgi:prepilin-type processing-associated H-X9-DG protein/prepilin-type N-terminal cleavage/methylation domain-containing protein
VRERFPVNAPPARLEEEPVSRAPDRLDSLRVHRASPARAAFTRNAFTLVELLVVIGIIAILMAILMPALSKVRQQARAVECSSNLRSLAQAWTMYANQNNGVVPPGRLPRDTATGGVYDIGDGDQYRPRWYELLGAIIKQAPCQNPSAIENDSWTIENRVFLCAAVPEWNNSRNYPFGYNYQFLGNARPQPSSVSTKLRYVKFPVKASSIRASSTVMAADCIGTAAGKPKAARAGYYADGTKDEFAIGNKAHLIDPPRLTAKSDYADHQHRNPADRSGPDFTRHGGKANFAMCDGSVQLAGPGDMGYVMQADGVILANGPGTSNIMFSGTGRDDDPPEVD